jgi:hypothetical protein
MRVGGIVRGEERRWERCGEGSMGGGRGRGERGLSPVVLASGAVAVANAREAEFFRACGGGGGGGDEVDEWRKVEWDLCMCESAVLRVGGRPPSTALQGLWGPHLPIIASTAGGGKPQKPSPASQGHLEACGSTLLLSRALSFLLIVVTPSPSPSLSPLRMLNTRIAVT